MKEFGTDLTKMQIWRTSFEMKLVLKIWSDMIADMVLMFLRAGMTEEESDLYRPLHLNKHLNVRRTALQAYKQRSGFRLLDR